MLTAKQVEEIRKHLEQAQNPLFFFDNDPDGLCSFLILRKYCEKGKGVLVRTTPMNSEYSRKVNELKPDYIFILDKPLVDIDFFKEIESMNIPVVWIDHHNVENEIPGFVKYYNPVFNKESSCEPVTDLCYQVSGRKDDLWLDVAGCVADHFIPENYKDFKKQFPELGIDTKEPFDILYNSQIGKIARIFNFALKDTTTNVVSMLKFLVNAKGPHDILEENLGNKTMHKRFSQIEKSYQKIAGRAMALASTAEALVFFSYEGEMSMTGEIANELSYHFPKKTIVIVHPKAGKINFSARGKKARELILKAIEGLPESRGGGHEEAVGGQIRPENLAAFRENLEKMVG